MLQENGFLINDLKKFEIQSHFDNSQYFDYKDFQKILFFVVKELKIEHAKVNNDFLDAFVALGGGSDGTGTIQMRTLLDVLKDFGISVDFLFHLDKNITSLDYENFTQIFESQNFDDNKSICSYISQRSVLPNVTPKAAKPMNQRSGFERNLNDFEKFLNQNPEFFVR